MCIDFLSDPGRLNVIDVVLVELLCLIKFWYFYLVSNQGNE